jgi:adenine-specific DNA-methyltransferase
MNYIGSKYSLLEEIGRLLDDHHISGNGMALDLFAGTGAVAQLLKQRGHIVYANDWQHYAYVTNVAFIEHNALPTFARLLNEPLWYERTKETWASDVISYSIGKRVRQDENLPSTRVLGYLNQLPGSRGPFYEAYCQGGLAGRMYYAKENGLRIQAIRDQIETWSRTALISAKEASWLIACLIESADRVANTASVYGAYLKHIKRSAQKPLSLVALQPIPSHHAAHQHHVFCQDSLTLLSTFSPGQLNLCYVDPPYNHRQYASNYHVLETIARWDLDQFEPRGVTGLRDAQQQRSVFCRRRAVEAGFRTLFERVNAEFVLFSYNNEGLLSEEKLRDLFETFCTDVQFRQIKFKRFRADVDHANRIYKADHTHEFLVLGRPISAQSNT